MVRLYPEVVGALGTKPLLKTQRQFETCGSRYINDSHPEIGTDRFCKDTEKSAGDVKKRQDFVWFPLTTCCCSVPMYDGI